MTTIDRSIDRHGRTLLLGFSVIIVGASIYSLYATSPKSSKLKDAQIDDEPLPKDPADWTEQQLSSWLKRRYVAPPVGTSKEQLIEFVTAFRY